MAIVLLTPTAQQQADALPKVIRARIDGLLLRLERWPNLSGAKPLSGDLAGRWRVRTGDYRLQFRVEQGQPAQGGEPAKPDVLKVEKIGHRNGFYD